MSHLAAESAYKKLEERINKFPQGAPPSETLYKILSILFNEKASHIIETASCIGISMCYCRHKMETFGKGM